MRRTMMLWEVFVMRCRATHQIAPLTGVPPSGRTGSGANFDPGAGVLVLERVGAEGSASWQALDAARGCRGTRPGLHAVP